MQRAGEPWFLSYFKTMSIGAEPWMELTTSCSAVNCSNNWANPATVKKHVVSLLNHHNNKCYFPYLVQYRLCGKYIVEAFEWHTLFDKKSIGRLEMQIIVICHFNWAELTLILQRLLGLSKETCKKYWPIADQCLPSNDRRLRDTFWLQFSSHL